MVMRPLPKRFSVAEYEELWRIGFFHEDDRIELLDGEIIEMAAIGGDHAGVVRQITRIIMPQTPKGYIVDVQNPLRLNDDSMPQPDLAIIRDRAYGGALPIAADTLLVIEVTDSALDHYYTHNRKLSSYARANIPETWLIDLAEHTIVRYTEPSNGQYSQVVISHTDQRLTAVILPTIVISASQVFRIESDAGIGWYRMGSNSLADFFAIVEDYRSRADDHGLRQFVTHFMGNRLLTDSWWFANNVAELAKTITIASAYPESVIAFFRALAAREQSRKSFAEARQWSTTPFAEILQWQAIWDICGKQPEPVAQLLIALCNSTPGKRLSDLPPLGWWAEWEAAIAPFDSTRIRELCEQLWAIPAIADTVGGYYTSDLVKTFGRAALWGIAAVADRYTVDLLASIPHQIKEPTFVPAMAILSLGQIHRLGRVRAVDIPARLHQLKQGVKSKISQRVIDATLARITTP